jgi:hypothetical protein
MEWEVNLKSEGSFRGNDPFPTAVVDLKRTQWRLNAVIATVLRKCVISEPRSTIRARTFPVALTLSWKVKHINLTFQDFSPCFASSLNISPPTHHQPSLPPLHLCLSTHTSIMSYRIGKLVFSGNLTSRIRQTRSRWM